MFLILTCSFFDDPNDVDDWDVEEKIACLFKTRGEAVDAIHKNFEFVNEKLLTASLQVTVRMVT